jgi:hypothetical protein
MAVTWGWDVGSKAERKPECDRNPCKVQSALALFTGSLAERNEPLRPV